MLFRSLTLGSIFIVNILVISIFIGTGAKASDEISDDCDCSQTYSPVVGPFEYPHDPRGCELTYQEMVSCGYQFFQGEWQEVFANDFKCEDSYLSVFCFCDAEGNACDDDDSPLLK